MARAPRPDGAETTRAPRPARMAGAALAAVALAAGLALALEAHREPLARYGRFFQPGFDARVYMAMADGPAFFTLEPWGYRVLAPWLVSLLAREPGAGTFLAFTLGGLFTAGLLLYAWLRRLGHAPPAAALGVALFGLSPPVSWAVLEPFMAEPLVIVLLVALLLALERHAGVAVLAFVAALGALGKDIFLFFLPVVFFARAGAVGWRRALRDALVVALPAVAVTWLLRAAWTPYVTPAEAGGWPGADAFWLGAWRILAGIPLWLGAALLFGATPLALAGAFLQPARAFLRRYGYLLAVTWALPFAASVYTTDRVNMPFFADDVPRLLLYALPPTLHLALLAVERSVSRVRPRAVPAHPGGAPLSEPVPPTPLEGSAGTLARPNDVPGTSPAGRPGGVQGRAVPAQAEPAAGLRRWLTAGAALGTAAVVAFPLVALDPYRRVDLRGPRDGPLVLAVCRQSLSFARRLVAGRTVDYEIATRRYRPAVDDRRYLERMRWFLRDGWGHAPHYAEGPVVMQSRHATVLLPCLRPDDWTLTLGLDAPAPVALAVRVNGRALHHAVFNGELRLKVDVPRDALFRGDNELALVAADDAPAVELTYLRVQPPR